MTEQPISDEVALRIALAARSLPDVSVGDLIHALQKHLGEDINETSLNNLTVTQLKTALGQTYSLDGEEDGEESTISLDILKEAVRILWGEVDDAEEFKEALPPLESFEGVNQLNSIRIAVASNNDEELDGHFGSCLRYLIYQLSASELKLVDIRSASGSNAAEDKNAFRVDLLKDCQVLYVVSIGGPAAAKVIKANIYPMKVDKGGQAREILQGLQKVINTSPPPWLAKALGVAVGERVKNYKAATVN
jgi:nitrogen fixation protein NifX